MWTQEGSTDWNWKVGHHQCENDSCHHPLRVEWWKGNFLFYFTTHFYCLHLYQWARTTFLSFISHFLKKKKGNKKIEAIGTDDITDLLLKYLRTINKRKTLARRCVKHNGNSTWVLCESRGKAQALQSTGFTFRLFHWLMFTWASFLNSLV